jgi:nucleoredoxin
LCTGFQFNFLFSVLFRCPPCRRFTPVLAEFYTQIKEQDESDLEIVFVSSDSDESSFGDYFGDMPWISVPFADRSRAESLGSRFGVRGIPFFVVLNAATGDVKDADARSTVQEASGNVSKALSKWSV